MSSDLLDRLAQLDRETHLEHDPRWDALATGKLSPSQVEELRAEAEEQGRADLFEAFAPLDAAAHERLASHATWLLRATSDKPVRVASAARPRTRSLSMGPRVTPNPGARRARLADETQRWSRGAFAKASVVAFCAAAVAIGLFIRGIGREEPELAASVPSVSPSPPPCAALPPYAVEASEGDVPSAVRSEPAPGETPPLAASISILGAGTPFVLVLRPATDVLHSVDVRACASREGRVTAWAAPWERSAQGSFRVEGTRESLFAAEPPGEVTLLFAVGPAPELPSCDELASLSQGPPRLLGRDDPSSPPAVQRAGILLLRHRVGLR